MLVSWNDFCTTWLIQHSITGFIMFLSLLSLTPFLGCDSSADPKDRSVCYGDPV